MARGKYARRAELRRDRESLAEEAQRASLAAERADKEREAALAKANAELEAARKELAALRRHVSEQSSPALEEARQQIEGQRRRIVELSGKLDDFREFADKAGHKLVARMSAEFDISREAAIDWVVELYAPLLPESWDFKEEARNLYGAKGKHVPLGRAVKQSSYKDWLKRVSKDSSNG